MNFKKKNSNRGNPAEKQFHDCIGSYAPVDNVVPGAKYPTVLVTAGWVLKKGRGGGGFFFNSSKPFSGFFSFFPPQTFFFSSSSSLSSPSPSLSIPFNTKIQVTRPPRRLLGARQGKEVFLFAFIFGFLFFFFAFLSTLIF